MVDAVALGGYAALDRAGALNAHIATSLAWRMAWAGPQPDLEATIANRAASASTNVQVDFIKIMLDGIPPSRTAAVLDPYVPDGVHAADYNGYLTQTPESLLEDMVKLDARKFGLVYDGPEPYADMIRTVIRSLVERGKGLELNTSPLRMGQPEPCPSFQVLRWYRELGGEILTFGSDAHQPEAIGSYFDAALEIARAAGFTRLATFEHRKTRWVKI